MDKLMIITVLAALGWVAGAAVGLPREVDCPRYWCEGGVAALWAVAGVLHEYGALPVRWLPVVLVLCALGVPLVICDVRALRLPNVLTVPAYPALGLAAVLAEPDAWQRILCAAALLGGVHLLVRILRPGALGGGDVKLAGALGLVVGARGWPAVLAVAPLAAVITALVGLARRRRSRLPHGPGLLAAALVLAAG